MTFTERLEAVIDDLARQGITFVFDTTTRTSGDACTAAMERHGRRIAFVHEEGGYWVDGGVHYRSWRNGEWVTSNKIRVSFDHETPTDADGIVLAFSEQDFYVYWSGDPCDAVEVTLS